MGYLGLTDWQHRQGEVTNMNILLLRFKAPAIIFNIWTLIGLFQIMDPIWNDGWPMYPIWPYRTSTNLATYWFDRQNTIYTNEFNLANDFALFVSSRIAFSRFSLADWGIANELYPKEAKSNSTSKAVGSCGSIWRLCLSVIECLCTAEERWFLKQAYCPTTPRNLGT